MLLAQLKDDDDDDDDDGFPACLTGNQESCNKKKYHSIPIILLLVSFYTNSLLSILVDLSITVI